MKVSDRIIQGSFDKAITAKKPAQLPKTYQATLQIIQKIVADESGQEQIDYFLVDLEPPPGPTVFLTNLSERDS
jgi:hypothetical protein